MYTLQAHEVFIFRPMAFIGQPQIIVDSLSYFFGFETIRFGIFSYFFGYLGRHLVGPVIISRRVRYSAAVVLEGIACPYTTIGIVKAVVVGVEITLLPSKMRFQYRPHTAHIVHISRPVEMPQQLIDIAKIHIVVVHELLLIGITGNITVAVHLRSPFLQSPSQIERTVLCRMRNDRFYLGNLRSGITVEVFPCPVVATYGIARISGTPTVQRHTPTNGSVHPHLGGGIPNTVGCHTQCRPERIEIGIGRNKLHRRGDLGTALVGTIETGRQIVITPCGRSGFRIIYRYIRGFLT